MRDEFCGVTGINGYGGVSGFWYEDLGLFFNTGNFLTVSYYLHIFIMAVI